MDDVLLVRRFEGLRDLAGDAQRFGQRQGAFQGPAGHVLQHQVVGSPGLLQAVNSGDVGVVQRRQHPGLALEAGEAFRVFGEALGQDLDGHLAAELAVGGAIDDAHAAGAELLFDAVVAEGLTDHGKGPPGRDVPNSNCNGNEQRM